MTCPASTRSSSPCRRRWPRLRDRHSLRAGRSAGRRRRARAVERACPRARRGSPRARDARDDRGRPRPHRSPASCRSRSAARSVSMSSSSQRTRSARRSASSTVAPSSPSSRALPSRRAAVLAGKIEWRHRRRRRLRRQRQHRYRLCYPGSTMKTEIHPEYVLAHVTCSCGNEFMTRSTKSELHVEVCSHCHPFYTGKQKLMDAGGRVERFQRRLEKAAAASPRSARRIKRDGRRWPRERLVRRPGRARRRDDARPGRVVRRRPDAERRRRRGDQVGPLADAATFCLAAARDPRCRRSR